MKARLMAVIFVLVSAGWPAVAAAQPPGRCSWCLAVDEVRGAFTGTIADGLVTIAIVVAGLLWALNIEDGKRRFLAVLFGGAMALSAEQFVAWLF